MSLAIPNNIGFRRRQRPTPPYKAPIMANAFFRVLPTDLPLLEIELGAPLDLPGTLHTKPFLASLRLNSRVRNDSAVRTLGYWQDDFLHHLDAAGKAMIQLQLQSYTSTYEYYGTEYVVMDLSIQAAQPAPLVPLVPAADTTDEISNDIPGDTTDVLQDPQGTGAQLTITPAAPAQPAVSPVQIQIEPPQAPAQPADNPVRTARIPPAPIRPQAPTRNLLRS